MAESPVSTPRAWLRVRIRDIIALTAIVGLAVALATIWKESSETAAKQSRFQTVQTVATEARIRRLWQHMLSDFGAVPHQGAIYDAQYNGVDIIISESLDGYTHDRNCRFQMLIADDSAALQQVMEFVIPRLFQGHQWQPVLEKALDEIRQLQEQSTSTRDEIQQHFELNGIEVELTVESDRHRRDLVILMSL